MLLTLAHSKTHSMSSDIQSSSMYFYNCLHAAGAIIPIGTVCSRERVSARQQSLLSSFIHSFKVCAWIRARKRENQFVRKQRGKTLKKRSLSQMIVKSGLVLFGFGRVKSHDWLGCEWILQCFVCWPQTSWPDSRFGYWSPNDHHDHRLAHQSATISIFLTK